MKEYMLLIWNEIDHQVEWSENKMQDFLTACERYINKLTMEQKLKAAQPLIRTGNIISGSKGAWKYRPFEENKEVIVGYYHIYASNMDEAIAIAKDNPEFEFGHTAKIEVRPIKIKEISTTYTYPND